MEKLELTMNKPEVIALQFADGKVVRSQFGGEQVMYTLVDDRRAYFPTSVAEKIRKQGIGARVPFEIVKLGKSEFEVKNLMASRAGETGASSWQSSPATSRSASTEVPPQQAYRSAPAAPAPEPALTTSAARMCAAMCAAVDAVIETQAYATRRGLGVTFSEESVRAIGLSIYIGDCKGGRA